MEYIKELVLAFLNYPYLVSFLGGFFTGGHVILFLAILSAQGLIPLWIVFVFSLLGILVADIMYFAIGKIKSLSVLKRSKIIHGSYLRARQVFEKTQSNLLILIIAKLVGGVGMFCMLYLGRKRMGFKEFLKYNTVLVFIWGTIIVTVGWLAGRGVYLVLQVYNNLKLGILMLGVILLIYYVIGELISRWLMKEKDKFEKIK